MRSLIELIFWALVLAVFGVIFVPMEYWPEIGQQYVGGVLAAAQKGNPLAIACIMTFVLVMIFLWRAINEQPQKETPAESSEVITRHISKVEVSDPGALVSALLAETLTIEQILTRVEQMSNDPVLKAQMDVIRHRYLDFQARAAKLYEAPSLLSSLGEMQSGVERITTALEEFERPRFGDPSSFHTFLGEADERLKKVEEQAVKLPLLRKGFDDIIARLTPLEDSSTGVDATYNVVQDARDVIEKALVHLESDGEENTFKQQVDDLEDAAADFEKRFGKVSKHFGRLQEIGRRISVLPAALTNGAGAPAQE